MRKIGLIVNPIAGMGGSVGLKGTDSPEILAKAKELGAKPVAPERAIETLLELKSTIESFDLLVPPEEMGEREAKEAGFKPRIIGKIAPSETTAKDTKRVAKEMTERDVDLILAAGGDGTMRDVLDVVDTRVPILGIPTGVKMFSSVFANTSKDAGKLVKRFLVEDLPLREAEVMDVDEGAFRRDELRSELKGHALTPYEPLLTQSSKMPSPSTGSEKMDKRAIAKCIVEAMSEDQVYILGPGTTTRKVAEELGIKNSTLLGVDLIKDMELLATDVREDQILEELEDGPGTIIVSPIGRQGFILGRGNQQISSKVIMKVGRKNIIILATPTKLEHTDRLKVDTGDPELDQELRGDMPVIVGYWLKRTIPIL